MFRNLFKDASFLPHGFCLLWDPWLIGAYLFSDIAIFIAYSAIPVAIYLFLKQRPELALSNLAWLFALFILFCGVSHLASAVALYMPIYEAQAAIKVVTAGVSLATAFVIFPLIPKALAIPSPEQLQKLNAQLQREVEAHLVTTEELRQARDQLQVKVQEQMSALARASAVVAALEESPDVLIYAKSREGKVLTANPASIAAIGRAAEDVIGKDESEFLTNPEEIVKIRDVYKTVRDTGQPMTVIEHVSSPDGTKRIYLSTKVPLRNAAGDITGIVGVSVDVSEREALMEKLQKNEELLRLGSEAAEFGSCELNLSSEQLQISQSLETMLGVSGTSLSLSEFINRIHPDYREAVQRAFHAKNRAELEFRDIEPSNASRWFLLRGQRIDEGNEARFLGAIADITRRKRAEHRTSDLMRELIHRGRNLLTVVQVLARNSLTPPRTILEGREVFIDRLHAFARGYELFVDGNHMGLTLRQLITAEFKRFPNQCVMDGPEFLLNERSAQTLGLVIHELMTNAAKYGALSRAEGRVFVRWSIDNSERLRFEWREEGGPTVSEPTKKGFGTGLIERMLKSDFQAEQSERFAAAGFRFSFQAPLNRVRASSVGSAEALHDMPLAPEPI
jgi:PAS domain S-box-containing protein